MNVDNIKTDWHGNVPVLGDNIIDNSVYNNPLELEYIDEPTIITKLSEECVGFLKYAQQLGLAVCMVDSQLFVNLCNQQFSRRLVGENHELKQKNIFTLLREQGFVISDDTSDLVFQSFLDKRKMTLIIKGDKSTWKISTKVVEDVEHSNTSGKYLLLLFQQMEVIASDKVIENENIKLQQELKELKNFSYLLAHDLKSPLRIIQAFAELLSEDSNALPKETSRIVEIIRQKSSQGKSLVDDLLSLFKLKSRQLKFEEVDMNSLVQNLLLELPPRGTIPCIEIPEPLPTIIGVKSLLNQLFVNLLSNAIKFTSSADEPNIKVQWKQLENNIQLTICDNGIGIDMKYKDEIFDPFFRLNVSENYRGNGLGLSMVKNIIEVHNGHIWVDSVLGEYTKFYIVLPIK